jgi:Domain of unknown function (DUF6457)
MHVRREHGTEPHKDCALDAWIAELAAALDIDPQVIDRNLVLEISRGTHRVARAAAPLTIFLIGMAAGQNGGSADAVNQAAATAKRLAANRRSDR